MTARDANVVAGALYGETPNDEYNSAKDADSNR